jgi:sarcosine oxidase subunit gamma
MSDPVSALAGAVDTGGLVHISEAGPMGMITLRGDLSEKVFRKALKDITSLDVPDVRRIAQAKGFSLAWMSPDELLVICDYGSVEDCLAVLQARLADVHALAVNVSDARAVFDVKGAEMRDVVAKLAPVDMHVDAFQTGMFRRTRFAQVPAAFWITDEDAVRVVCFRSVAQYMFDLLKMAAQPGSAPQHHIP